MVIERIDFTEIVRVDEDRPTDSMNYSRVWRPGGSSAEVLENGGVRIVFPSGRTVDVHPAGVLSVERMPDREALPPPEPALLRATPEGNALVDDLLRKSSGPAKKRVRRPKKD